MPSQDWMTYSGAARLAEMVRSYWAAKGHKVNVSVVECERERMKAVLVYGLKSDLINGLPRSR